MPTAPYPTTKHRFVSMLLYASIESHCIVQLTNTKTADSGQQTLLDIDVVSLLAKEQPI